MVRAIIKKGVFVPQEPLPNDWIEGVEVEVERPEAPNSTDAIDQWFAELERSASQLEEEDDKILQSALQEIRTQEKELARKQIGLQG